MNQLLLEYSYLQILDFLTTLAFLLSGVKEGNPLVRAVLTHSPSTIAGLMLVKGAAILLGAYCWRMGRRRILVRINILFAVVIAWNLLALIMGAAAGKGPV